MARSESDSELLDLALEITHGLTEWEVCFVEDLAQRRKVRGDLRLTDRQREKLIEIISEAEEEGRV